MDHARHRRNPDVADERSAASASGQGEPIALISGELIDLFGSCHRIVAIIGERVLMIHTTMQQTYFTQDADGSIQLPTSTSVLAMIADGRASLVPMPTTKPSAFARMRVQVDMTNAADVPQGDKAIWIFMTANWTPALEARFGPHDEPWKIRRWRTALRRAVAIRQCRNDTTPES